ncbi:hypothetical protein VTK56DRAFT_5630 [Thermocarpiscus australiensis]
MPRDYHARRRLQSSPQPDWAQILLHPSTAPMRFRSVVRESGNQLTVIGQARRRGGPMLGRVEAANMARVETDQSSSRLATETRLRISTVCHPV